MRFSVDSSIVLDILLDDPTHGARSQKLLEAHLGRGAVVICPVAFSECCAAFTPTTEFAPVAQQMGLTCSSYTPEICALAAQIWQEYRKQGGRRKRIIPEFLIGAHAMRCSNGLLSRDRGFFRKYFIGLDVIQP